MSDPGRPHHALRRLIGPFTTPIYGALVARRNAAFDVGRGVQRVPVPVISVGNLTVGGTGKTPFVTWLVQRLLASAASPAIALRGYRARHGESDEARLYQGSLPGVPVLVNPNRAAAIKCALAATPGAFDRVILDDGFQHRRLARDLDIVLIDARAGTLDDRLLPAGDLREPVSELRRARAVVLTHAEGLAEPELVAIEARMRLLAGRTLLVCRAQHLWTGLRVRENGVEREEPTTWLCGRAVMVACAIGRPERFIAKARERADVRAVETLPDHDPFSDQTCRRISERAAASGANAVLMTEKDWTKARVHAWPLPVARPVLEMSVTCADELVDLALHAGREAGPP